MVILWLLSALIIIGCILLFYPKAKRITKPKRIEHSSLQRSITLPYPLLVLYNHISTDYSLSPPEKRRLYNLLLDHQGVSGLTTLAVIQRLIHDSNISYLKRFYMILYVIEHSDSNAGDEYRGILETWLYRGDMDEETVVNVRDYLLRARVEHINPFINPITEFNWNQDGHDEPWTELPAQEVLNQINLFRYYEEANARAKKTKTIYESAENVHSSRVNQTTLSAARRLILRFGTATVPETYQQDLFSLSSDSQKLEKALRRIQIDASTYDYVGDAFTLHQIFCAVLNFIYTGLKEDEKNTALRALVSELESKYNKCGTGYLNAIMSSIQGLQTDYSIDIGIENEVYGTFSKYIEMKIKEAPRSEELLENLQTEDKQEVICLIFDHLPFILDQLSEEYKQVADRHSIDTSLKRAVNKYIGRDVFQDSPKCA